MSDDVDTSDAVTVYSMGPGPNADWTDRMISPRAVPQGSHYNYYALVPTEDLWSGHDLSDSGSADQSVYCLMTDSAGQLPGDGS